MPSSAQAPHVEKIQFRSDTFMLNGYLHKPALARPPFIVGSHGLFSDKASPKQIALAKYCNARKMAYFRFDHRGCGESKAPLQTLASLSGRCNDLIAAAKMLRSRGDLGDSMGLFGSSMGGSVCLAVAHDLAAQAVVTWAAPIRSADLVSQQTEATGNSPSPFKDQPFDLTHRVVGLRNILILHGDADETVPLSHAQEIYDRVSDPKKLLVFPRSDHRMRHTADQQMFVHESTLWFQTYLNHS